MALKINDGELSCYAIDEDTAVVTVKEQNFVVDYSTLIDFLTDLASVASQLEAAAAKAAVAVINHSGDQSQEICPCQRLH